MKEQEEILKYIHSSLIARLTQEQVSLTPINLREFWMKLLKSIRSDSYATNISLGPIVFVINDIVDGTGNDMFHEISLLSFFETGTVKISNVIFIGKNGKIIQSTEYQKIIINNTDDVLTHSTNKPGYVFAFVKGNELTIFTKGKQIKIIPDIFSANPTGVIKGTLPAARYRTLIERHYHEEIVGERRLLYWSNKAKRELITSPEKHFRKKLGGFLYENVSDGIVDEECLNDNTTNKNDIRIVVPITKEIYILEVKWLGKSAGASFDGQTANGQANSGIKQLHIYLKAETRCICGVLVIYDARKNRAQIIWNNVKTKWDARIDQNPIFLELDPTSASAKAKQEVRKSKKK